MLADLRTWPRGEAVNLHLAHTPLGTDMHVTPHLPSQSLLFTTDPSLHLRLLTSVTSLPEYLKSVNTSNSMKQKTFECRQEEETEENLYLKGDSFRSHFTKKKTI